MTYYYYDKDGTPIGMENKTESYQLLEKKLGNKDYKVIRQEYTKNKKYWVSTVWLGIDHSFVYSGLSPNPHPIIFETMVFGVDEDGHTNYADLDVERYETEVQAAAGHIKMFNKWNRKNK